MTNFTKILSAMVLVAVASTSAVAQTDFGSPIGAGSGVGGAISPFLPGRAAGAAGRAGSNRPMPAGIGGRIQGVGGVLSNSPTSGVRVVSPAGGTVVLSQAISQALGAVLGGSPTPAQISTVTAAGVPAAVATALQAFGARPTVGNHAAAVDAYNAAVAALPAGQPVPPALLAVRAALAGAGPRAAGPA